MHEPPDLPLRFTDALFISAVFPLPSSSARALLPPATHVNLIEVFPYRAVLAVSFAHYRQSPFGSYTEAVLAVMASHERTTPVLTLANLIQESRYPAYVLHMLVSSPQAQQMGTEVWALPRVLAEVQVEEAEGQARCAAHLDGQAVLHLTATRPTTDRARAMQIETYSQRDDTLLHSVMRCSAEAYGRSQGEGVQLSWGEHPIGQRLAAAEVSAMPLMIRYYDQMQAELGAPTQCSVNG